MGRNNFSGWTKAGKKRFKELLEEVKVCRTAEATNKFRWEKKLLQKLRTEGKIQGASLDEDRKQKRQKTAMVEETDANADHFVGWDSDEEEEEGDADSEGTTSTTDGDGETGN